MSTLNELKKQYGIDRKTASKLLKVSIRTIDRYIKDKKLSTQVINGRIWLDQEEIRGFGEEKKAIMDVDRIKMSTLDLSIDDDIDNVDKNKIMNGKNVNSIYKNLFEESQNDVKEKQGRLEMANYRVGQLEAQLKNSIPLLEYRNEQIKTRIEKLIKKMAFSTILILLALQPLWLILFLLQK